MYLKVTRAVTVVMFLASGTIFAAGGPMNEDLTSLAIPAQKAIEAGKAGNAADFQAEAETALKEAKDKTDSAAQQRVTGKLKRAIEAGKRGDLAAGVQLIEESMRDMKKAGAPQFGGGS